MMCYIALFICASLPHGRSNMRKWEYKNIFLVGTGFMGAKANVKELDELMNTLGADGWELVSTIPRWQNFSFAIAIFKRELNA